MDVMVSVSTLPKIITTLTQLWLSERPEVTNGTAHALQTIIEDCVAPACASSDVVEACSGHLQKCFRTIESCLGYQYNKSWHQVLHVIGVMFKVRVIINYFLQNLQMFPEFVLTTSISSI